MSFKARFSEWMPDDMKYSVSGGYSTDYLGEDSDFDPRVSNEFAVAAFRLHTLVPSNFKNAVGAQDFPLEFWKPEQLLDNKGILKLLLRVEKVFKTILVFLQYQEIWFSSMYYNISSVVEFQRWWVLKSQMFGQESSYSKETFFKDILQ